MQDIFLAEIKRLHPILVKRARGLLKRANKPTHLAEDVIQDVMADCLKPNRIETTTDVFNRGKLEYYLGRCVWLQVCVGIAKKPSHIELTDYIAGVVQQETSQGDMSNLIDRATAENLDLAIRALDQYEAELIRLWSMDEFSPARCSKAIGISDNQLKQQIHHAIKKLKNYVQHSNRSSGSIQ